MIPGVSKITRQGVTIEFAAHQPDHSDGIMACVRPDDPGRFVVEGGTPEEEVHLTLAYFGKVTDEQWTDAAQQQVAEVISSEIASEREPIHGEITAVTTFELAGEDDPPLVLLVDAPGLGEMRAALVKSVNASLGSDQEIKSNHDFMPHITLCYGASDDEVAFAESLIGEKVRFDGVELVWGEESSVWPLRGAISNSEGPSGLRSEGIESTPSAQPGAQEGDSMPYEIVEMHPECDAGDPYAVVKSADGELMGCHPSEEDAKTQLAALNAAEKGQEDHPAEASADPLAIVIADEPTRDERLAVLDEFVAAEKVAGGGDVAADHGEEEDVAMMPCPTCDGTGQVDGEECPTCDGTGEVEVEVQIEESEEDMEAEGPAEFKAVPVHHGPTTDGPWDGPAAEARAKSGEDVSYYEEIYAWNDPEGDPKTKDAWKFIHHEVSEDGTPGAANLKACSTGIGVLNGGRGGTTIPDADYKGVYEHLAAHLADADKEAPALASDGAAETMAVEGEASFKALPPHSSATKNPPTFTDWDGSEVKKRTRSGEAPAYYGKIYAWVDSNGNPTNKTAYKFPHHEVSEDGTPGAAVLWAVHSAIAVIDDSTIPTADYQGVYNHLAKHLRDGGVEDIPELGEDVASVEEVRAALATMRARFHAMASEAAIRGSDIASTDDVALVGEVIRRWFESVARTGDKDDEIVPVTPIASDEFAADEDAPVEDQAAEEDSKVVGDFKKGDFEWEGVLIVEGLPSGDGRMIDKEALTWRDLPIPLMLQTINAGGHDGAVIAGSIHEVERRGHEIIGRGYFDSGEAGQEAKRLLTEGTMRGVSADIDSVVAELRDANGEDVAMEDAMFGDPEGITEVLVEGRIMGATMTPFPAFQEAALRVISPEEQGDDLVLVASGAEVFGEVWRVVSPYPLVGRGGEPIELKSLVASASDNVTELPVIPVNPPMEWFSIGEMDEAHPVIIYPNGRIYGLVAKFGSCHIGFRDRCVDVPRSSDGYRNFRNKSVLTVEGELVATGVVYMDTVHPDLKLRASDTQAFYAHTGCAIADVALYENEFGIVAAGAVRSTASPEQVRSLRGSDLSPDWRNIDGRLEVVGLLAVNVSGFITPALAASAGEVVQTESLVPRARYNSVTGQFDSLVAAGSMRECAHCGKHSMDGDAVLAILEVLNAHAARLAELTEAVRPFRVERLASRVASLAINAKSSIEESDDSGE
jgi:2'-5' RNA ligase